MRRRRVLRLASSFLAGGAIVGAIAWWIGRGARREHADALYGPGIYHGFGTVVGLMPAPSPLHATRPAVILRHEAIPDLMEQGMTHPFLVESEALLRDIRPGARVEFTLRDTPGALLVVRLKVVR